MISIIALGVRDLLISCDGENDREKVALIVVSEEEMSRSRLRVGCYKGRNGLQMML